MKSFAAARAAQPERIVVSDGICATSTDLVLEANIVAWASVNRDIYGISWSLLEYGWVNWGVMEIFVVWFVCFIYDADTT